MKPQPIPPAIRRFVCCTTCIAGALGILLPPALTKAGYVSTGNNYLLTSTWVGHGSTGSLVIDEDYDFHTGALTVGQQAGGNGTVTVRGTGTLLTLTQNLNLGSAGRGVLNLELGATMTTNRSIMVGTNGTAEINIHSGAVLTSLGSSACPTGYTVNIGSTAGAASATVDGAGSAWVIPNMGIGIGNTASSRTGALTISNGGVVSATAIAVVKNSSLLVTGLDPTTHAAATLDLAGSFRIDGSATVSAGGIVNAQGNNHIGSSLNEQGAMTVTGAGSQVNVVGSMIIAASSGQGSLTVTDGAVINVSTTGSARGTGNGTLTVGDWPTSSNPGTPAGVATLYIGTGGAAGRLEVSEVYGFVYTNNLVPPADSTVIFNHNETGHQFTHSSGTGIQINGGTKVRQVAGTTIFTAASTYQGGTQITGGALLVNNSSGSGTGTGAVTVSGAGVLGGRGSIIGDITVESGGSTHPGNSQILTVGDLAYEAGATARFTLTALGTDGQTPTAGENHDQIALTGALNIHPDATLQLELVDFSTNLPPGGTGDRILGNYFLFTPASGSIAGKFDFLSLLVDGTTYTQSIVDGRATFTPFDLAFDVGYTGDAVSRSLLGGNDLTVQVSSVPEPVTGWLLVLGAALVAAQRRKR